VDLDGAVLADAVGAVGGLVLDGGVPPAVEVEDVGGGGEVEADTAGLEGDDEDGGLAVGLDELRSGLIAYSLSMVDYRKIITIEPDKRGGKPCVRGLRITVYDVLDYLASGMSVEEVLADFPDLTREDIQACLAFAADRERRVMSRSA
jgi:uncharacterized protein (DUF433 family)